jgi:hypothetical protein
LDEIWEFDGIQLPFCLQSTFFVGFKLGVQLALEVLVFGHINGMFVMNFLCSFLFLCAKSNVMVGFDLRLVRWCLVI